MTNLDQQGELLSLKENPHIIIASPIRQSPAILRWFLKSLERLITSTMNISYYFIDENDDPDASELLRTFATNHPDTLLITKKAPSSYLRNETTHYWSHELIWKVATYKNEMIAYAIQQNVDALLLIDSDILLHPQTLEQLYSCRRPIVSEIFWTRWQPDAYPRPQVWMMDEYMQWEQAPGEKLKKEEIRERSERFIAMLNIPGLYPVGGLGACTLIRKEALLRGVSFDPIYNLSFWGEDRHFCIRAAALGIPLYVDTHYPAYHIYRESDLPGSEQFLKDTAVAEEHTLAWVPDTPKLPSVAGKEFDNAREDNCSAIFPPVRVKSGNSIIHTLPLLIRQTTREKDLSMTLECLRSLSRSPEHHVIVYHQGELNRNELEHLLFRSGVTAEVLGDGHNVGIAQARQACFEHIYTHYSDTPYISEIHVDMYFPENWYLPLIQYLDDHDDPMICPGILTSSGELLPLKQQVTLPENEQELLALLASLPQSGVRPGFVHPVIHRREALESVGGYDLRYFAGKQGYEDDSLLIGYANYMGTRTDWRPKCLLSSWVYHATMAQRMSLPDKWTDFDLNRKALLRQYGGYGLEQLALLHDNPDFKVMLEHYLNEPKE
ncbi:glycosyltransferase family 2 protein [Paenibacillus senegalimassiliensis]|uniref:glycosyltransferase family 2 protein n=1 Tax=Paenibacillus senegalimassiliensis TaxID=1737426 RepID=UPI000AE01A7C|nr:hypothetical protein [Paenibacillus senegalimassiliensis]